MKNARLDRNLARNVRLLRTRGGLSQEELAEKSGLHRTYIGAVERAERNITLKTLARLGEALGVDPRRLLDGPGE